jgi:di/tripeptidase
MVEVLNTAVEKAAETENRQAATGRVAARIREVGSRPAGSLPPDSSLLTCLRLVDSHLAIRSHLDCASTDANIPLSLGWPALSLGAGGQGGGAHSRNEWFRPSGRPLGLSRIFLLLCLLLDDFSSQ